MCGFTGYIDTDGLSDDASDVIRSMTSSLEHRGPDDDAQWLDPEQGIALGFRRLAILELSSSGRQPMHSDGGRYVIAFNGEIYNHRELRRELDSREIAWKGNSDTETLLAAIERWGVEGTLDRTVGMFAFAVWDRERRCLVLARDRLGEKPLYYGWQDGTFLFGSELKALRKHPGFAASVDHGSVALYLRHGYIPSPYSIFSGIFKLEPGHLLRLDFADGVRSARNGTPQQYWSLRDAVARGTADPFTGSDDEAVDALEEVLTESIDLQRVADVPLGAFLSGGIDSSTITALLHARTTLPVKTFTVGFDEDAYDESTFAKQVAGHLGTDHTELRVSADEALAVVDQLPSIYDEPYGDSSAIPTLLVSRLARQKVTVALSGDAGDELFGGYGRYHRAFSSWSRVQGVPALGRTLVRMAAENVASGARLLGTAPGFERKLQSLSAATQDRIGYLYSEQMSLWKRPERVLRSALPEHPSILQDPAAQHGATPIEQLMYTDSLSYLPEDVLTKVDRAAMAVSLETRVPLLDHRVVEFAWRLPLHHKVRNGTGKWVLRNLLARYVPRSLFERPKMGFGVPIDHWLRRELRDWAETLLAADRLEREGFFQPAAVRGIWQDHLSGRSDWQYLLWPVLMFQAWIDNEKGGA